MPEPTVPPRSGRASREREGEPLRGIRFDAAYYYGQGLSARQLADRLTRSWERKGINVVYFYAYNRVYGARYITRYPGNVMEDYGRQDLLGHLIHYAHARGIKVIAWFYGFQHKQMWEAHPDWREKTADGRDYRPDPDSYYLCPRNPEVRRWWEGLIAEVLERYPELDGIDIAEPQVDLWGDNACYCDHCRAEFSAEYPGAAMPGPAWRAFRAEGMTELLQATVRLAHRYGKEAHITSVFTAGRDGQLLSPQVVRDAIGFDLEGVLGGPDRPDVVQGELIWQQWAALYGDRERFTASWTSQAVEQAKRLVRGRAKFIAHLELTDFGIGGLSAPQVAATVAAALRARPDGVDLYDAHLLERTEGVTEQLQMAWASF